MNPEIPKIEMRMIPLSRLKVHDTIQRGKFSRAHAVRIASTLDIDAIGVISVTPGAGDTYFIVDGQHRVAALRLAGYGHASVPCAVVSDLEQSDQASKFLKLNNTLKVDYLSQFTVRMIAEDKVALAISLLLEEYGWQIGGNGDGHFRAVSRLESAYLRDANSTRRAISTLTHAWEHARESADGRIVEGLARFYARYEDTVDDAVVTERLSDLDGGPGELIGRAQQLSRLIDSKVVLCVAEITVELYNLKRRANRLPPWRLE